MSVERCAAVSDTHVRAARSDEAALLSSIALRSKAHWGYSATFMAKCVPALTVTPEYIRRHPVYVADAAGQVRGFYSLREAAGELEIDLLFVEPQHIGGGVGGLLLTHALEQARATPHRYLLVESDPQAEPFYQRFGAERIGTRASSVEAGRQLPLLHFDLTRLPVMDNSHRYR